MARAEAAVAIAIVVVVRTRCLRIWTAMMRATVGTTIRLNDDIIPATIYPKSMKATQRACR